MTLPPPVLESDQPDDAVIGRALKWSLAVMATFAVAIAVLLWVLQPKAPAVAAKPQAVTLPETRTLPQLAIPKIPFVDITVTAGIQFVHHAGATGDKLLPETMGSGVACFDFDNDQDADLLFINSRSWPWDPAPKQPPTLALYQNDGQAHFTDVTADVGLDVSLYGMGVAVADYDHDGDCDIFVTAVGANHLFRNDNGRFVDVTSEAGVAGAETEWSTSASWFDYDRDGDLDLFVANYVKWSREGDLAQDFRLVGLGRAYGPPFAFQGTYPYLYRNEGNGKFTEVAEQAGLHIQNPATDVPMAKSLGVLVHDLDQDGWLDLVVANDTVQNFLFHNQQNGTFTEMGAASGVAFDSAGNARGAMGIDAAYFRNDAALGIAIGNFSNEMTALYVANGPSLQFTDDAIPTGLGPPSRLDLKFGVIFADFDLDGRPDLAAANGHLEEEIHQVQSSQHYAQPPHLFWNCGPEQTTEFVLLDQTSVGPDLLKPMVGRGLATADFDGDGDLDLVLTANRGSPRLLRNDQALSHHWLRIHCVDPQLPEAIGTVVEVDSGGRTLRQVVSPVRGYLSQSEFPLTFGLGPSTEVTEVRFLWPDGTRQTLDSLPVDQLHQITKATDQLP
ncbi:CRTAC1 family protein [bacterium]|nr:CRTAC1 family protein [bacterium]